MTDRRTGQWLIAQVLPLHRQRRQVPIVSARDAGAVGVFLLVAACTIQSGNAFAFRTTDDVSEMTVAIVALLRIICRRVTVDAARRSQDRIDLLPCSQPIGEPAFRCKGLALPGLEGAIC